MELPPYHPNCKGYIIPIVNEERINSKKEEKKEIINNLIKGKIKQVVLKEHLN
uniref:Minor capsid protein n=1 Tax=Podoviridae sp. ctuQh21 TaxID=2825284 RepID=A0A8S5PED6_9CAUD|nr:MAG TPA: minor capsid protein [Podoviridae sp. ctuQh21]